MTRTTLTRSTPTTTAATAAVVMLKEVRDEQGEVILEVEVALMVGEEVLEAEVGVMGATMVEGLDRVAVEVSGTIRWASLVEALTGLVGEDVEGLVEIWEALEVIEVLEVDLEVEGVVVVVDKGLAVSRWIQTHSEEPLDLSTLIRLRRTKDQLKPHRCKDQDHLLYSNLLLR